MKQVFVFLLLVIFTNKNNFSQSPVGSWTDHLCYSDVTKVVKYDDKIYCITEQGYFIYNTTDNSFQKFSTVTGLTDVGINNLAYYKERDILFISYINGNIDLIHKGIITNIPDLKNKVLTSKKGANSILFDGDYAYCSQDFGILVVDLVKNEIKDTYIIGSPGLIFPVNSLLISDQYFYAATDKGLFKALVTDPYLVDYSRWQRINTLPLPSRKISSIAFFQGNIVVDIYTESTKTDSVYIYDNVNWTKSAIGINTVVKEMTAYNNNLTFTTSGHVYVYNQNFQLIFDYNKFTPQTAIADDNNTLWVGDVINGLTKISLDGSFKVSYIYPSGPGSNSIWNMKANNNAIVVTGGALDNSWSDAGLPTGRIYRYQDNHWFNTWNYFARGYISLALDPVDPDKSFIGSWTQGIFVYEKNDSIDNYTDKNSSIQNIYPGKDYMRVGGINFDSENNMWVTNEGVASPISVRKADGAWKSFKYATYLPVITIGDILPDIYGQCWVILPRSNGLFIFDYNKTIDNESDDVVRRFNPEDVFGEQIKDVLCFANDKEGSVWVGTERGVVVYTNPTGVLAGETAGYQPRIPRNDGSDLADALLGSESVYCMAIDGANRKWFGTEKGGAFLISADGTKQIKNFNTSNSPLYSNFVRSITINPKTGEVFMGTDKGLISYREVATEGAIDLSNAYAFPNPVRPDFQGDVTITGLVENTSVKITDISGNLVFQTTSVGGSASWNVKNRNGQKVSTGVYLILLTNEDGSLTNIVKLLVVK